MDMYGFLVMPSIFHPWVCSRCVSHPSGMRQSHVANMAFCW